MENLTSFNVLDLISYTVIDLKFYPKVEKKNGHNKTHTCAIKVKRRNLTSFFRVEKILQVNFFFSFCHITRKFISQMTLEQQV